jgi:hypothetical protein
MSLTLAGPQSLRQAGERLKIRYRSDFVRVSYRVGITLRHRRISDLLMLGMSLVSIT